MERMWSLEIYKVTDYGVWPLVDIITGVSPEECHEMAEQTYDIESHHWVNPY